jgi:hypothetical protein
MAEVPLFIPPPPPKPSPAGEGLSQQHFPLVAAAIKKRDVVRAGDEGRLGNNNPRLCYS